MLKKFFITQLLIVLFLIPASTIIAQTDTITSSKDAPMIFDISPSDGPPAGGTEVTIFGMNFIGTTSVMFGSNPAADYTVDSDDQITATTPSGTGMVDVIVTASEQQSMPFNFIYHPPMIFDISPTHGPAGGGTSVEIIGSNLTGTTEVYFDSNAATGVIVDSDSQVTAISPSGSGMVNVTVIAAGQQSMPIDFTYDPPIFTMISPSNGPVLGGTLVEIKGIYLTGATEVYFDSNPATGVTVEADTLVTAISPAGLGTVDVTVIVAGSSSLPIEFSYDAPNIDNILPPNGPCAGGTPIEITGTNFTGVTVVKFDSIAIGFTVDSDSLITAVTPPGSGTSVDVSVQSSDLVSNIIKFNYNPPFIQDILPSGGPTYGGTSITISGINFTGLEEVKFDSIPATSFTLDGDSLIKAVSPPGTGEVDVTVKSDGQGSNSFNFNYYFAPAIPINVVISNDGSETTVTWDVVTGATSYKVYSSTDPYTGFEFDNTGILNGTSWTSPYSGNKLFYYVVAVD